MFQTVAANRLLTPGIVGFDAMFVLIQTLLVLLLGGIGYAALPQIPKFAIETLALAGAAMAACGALLWVPAYYLRRRQLAAARA